MLSSPHYLSPFVSNGSAAQYQKCSIPKDPRNDFWTIPIDSSAMNLAWPKTLDDQGSSTKRRLSDQDVELMIVDFKKFLVKHMSKQSSPESTKQIKMPYNFFNQNDLEEGTKSEEIKAALLNVVKPEMTPQEIFTEELNVLRETMTQYMKQRRVKNDSECEDFRFIIENPIDLLGGIAKILLKDLASVDASIKQLEDLCIRQGIEIDTNEAGPKEIQNSVDWLRFHIKARVSVDNLIKSIHVLSWVINSVTVRLWTLNALTRQ